MKQFLALLTAAIILALAPSPARAQENVPHLVQFSATLKDATARPVAGVASVTFAIYADQEGGAALWSETQNVLADTTGHYSVLLGSATSSGVPAELFGTGASRWLGVTAARQPEQPRVLLASVPYALKAGDADTLGGLPASAYVTTQSLAALAARPATTAILSSGTPANPASTNASSAPASSPGATQSSVTQATPTGSGTTNFLPLWTSPSTLGNSILFQSNSRIGVGTTTPVVTLDVNGDSIFRGSFQLVPQGTATAATGQPSHSYQWEASTYNSAREIPVVTAYGFRATPQQNNTDFATSSLDLYFGPGGGTLVDTGFSFNNQGIVTFAPGQTFTGASFNAQQITLPNTASGSSLITLGGINLLGDNGGPTNLFLGFNTGTTVTSSVIQTTAVGEDAMLQLTTGTNNTALGAFALSQNSTGSYNTGIGYESASGVVSGTYNTGVGVQALNLDSTGGENTSVGALSLGSTTAGQFNTAVGYSAGGKATGDGNTFIGLNADAALGVSYSTAIGYGAYATLSNSIILGPVGPGETLVGVGTTAPASAFDIESNISSVPAEPSPVLTLGNLNGGLHSTTAIDFNAYARDPLGEYNPDGRFAFVDEDNFSGAFVWYGNVSGAKNNGLQQNMALDANGNLSIRGSISKGGGSFKIDDPIDPAGKYLSHSFVESPDMMNLYNGIVTLDAHGRAEVVMPEWFNALNRDFRYTLTAIGSPAPKIYIAGTMTADGKFKIAGGKKGQQISWMVTGIRQDAWANAHRIPTEEEKPAAEQGHYLHPELFGAGPDMAVGAESSVAQNGSR